MAKNWYKKLFSVALAFITFLPVFTMIFELFRTGTTTINLTSYETPLTSVFSSAITYFNVNQSSMIYNIICYCFGWFLFVELIQIIYMALYYFINMIKSFLCRD